jgi:transcriptional regulator with XRE-family HTH domain
MAVMTLGEFLRSRRAALTPEAAGIVSYGARRVPGLRREELAQLAGVSPAYYTRLEQGQSTNASPSVLDALARAVASLRFIAGRFRDDRRLAELIGELTLKSPEFAALWGRHPVKRCTTGLKRMHHPEVGELDLCFEVLHLPDDSGQRLLTHTAAPGSEGALALLSRGRATPAR